mmetsp:Transcript_13808/g.30095  ORF Transcript_13808/g.30095 Transcript_13808/m.30095 type:complete len:97 (-) Transcript_13808:155-445(-)
MLMQRVQRVLAAGGPGRTLHRIVKGREGEVGSKALKGSKHILCDKVCGFLRFRALLVTYVYISAIKSVALTHQANNFARSTITWGHQQPKQCRRCG